MYNFDYLKEPFINWLKEKQKEIKEFQDFDLAKNAQEMLNYNYIDIPELDKTLLNLDCLPPSGMNLFTITKILYLKMHRLYSK